ncbi:HPF/RaiA family ribosome-associated protein [Azoarcus sp. PA01]|nr:HPF/RaiA family ribosome-associated protein [Azoarcus sp. PA01]
MEVQVESGRAAGMRFRNAIEARLRFALRRLSWLVPHATVRLSDLGRDAGPDKCCEVRLKVVGTRDVVVSAIARDWLQSIDDALKGAARRLERQYRRTYAA